jgi:hypothetical protein
MNYQPLQDIPMGALDAPLFDFDDLDNYSNIDIEAKEEEESKSENLYQDPHKLTSTEIKYMRHYLKLMLSILTQSTCKDQELLCINYYKNECYKLHKDIPDEKIIKQEIKKAEEDLKLELELELEEKQNEHHKN